jgi:hypothetical protein
MFSSISMYLLRVISVATMWAAFAHRPHGIDQADQFAENAAGVADESKPGADLERRRRARRTAIKWAIGCGVLITAVAALVIIVGSQAEGPFKLRAISRLPRIRFDKNR